MTDVGSRQSDANPTASRAQRIVERTVDSTTARLQSIDHVTTADGRTVLEVTLCDDDSFIVMYDPSMNGVETFFQLTVDHAVRQLRNEL
jgi:hypothetical protein